MMKPILFNRDMVQALLRNEKRCTRRIVKPQPEFREGEDGTPVMMDDGNFGFKVKGYQTIYDYPVTAPYHKGDILYVREAYTKDAGRFLYRADYPLDAEFCNTNDQPVKIRWKPSIHMPKEAARIFLRVTDVRMERLQEVNDDIPGPDCQVIREGFHYTSDFIACWDSTMPAQDRPKYGWFANPWVWVIEFERCEPTDF